MRMMKRVLAGIEAVLFDLDGTLVETNIDFPLMKREMLAFVERYGLDTSLAASLDILGIVDYLERSLVAVGKTAKAASARAEAMRRLEEIEICHSTDARAIKHAGELVERLRSLGIKIGIVTRNSRRASELSLEVVGMGTDMYMLAREDVPKTKPHPDHLLAALRHLGAAPDRSVMIGDHLMDVTAGKAARMRTIGIQPPGRPADFFDEVKPNAVAKDLQEILDAINDIHS